MKRLRDERGQTIAITAIFFVVLLGMVALTLDIGSWFRDHRRLQALTDASALAGAATLPDDTSQANGLALSYAAQNTGSLSSVTFGSRYRANDTITVTADDSAPGFVSKLFGISVVAVHATAAAVAAVPSEARFVVPIAVSRDVYCGPSCFGTDITLTLTKDPEGNKPAVPGNFSLLDLANGNGSVGNSTLADQLEHGYDAYLPLGNYDGASGAGFNSGPFQNALNAKKEQEILIPMYSSVSGSGSNAQYTIVGWAGFVITSFDAHGTDGTLVGHFTRLVVDGIVSGSSGSLPDYGARTIALVN